MELLAEIRQWLVDTEAWEWIFSGIGLPVLGLLLLRFRKKPPALRDKALPVASTFNSGGGDQNIGQGEGAVGKQTNIKQDVKGDGNVTTGTGDIHIEHHHHADPTPSEPPPPPHLLPSKDTVFLHREVELTWLDKHLQPDKVVAVCAPGGMGKTALAARAVRRLPEARFPDGIVFHSFYHQPDTAMVMQTIAHAFGLKAGADLERQVALALGDKQALLILDGAEEAADLPAVLRLRGGCACAAAARRSSPAGGMRTRRICCWN